MGMVKPKLEILTTSTPESEPVKFLRELIGKFKGDEIERCCVVYVDGGGMKLAPIWMEGWGEMSLMLQLANNAVLLNHEEDIEGME